MDVGKTGTTAPYGIVCPSQLGADLAFIELLKWVYGPQEEEAAALYQALDPKPAVLLQERVFSQAPPSHCHQGIATGTWPASE